MVRRYAHPALESRVRFRMNRRFILAFGGAALLAPPSLAATRPTNWAIPMALDGVPNLHRVTRHLYRSAQPTAAGLGNLAGRGIKTVINLRQLVDDVPLAAGTDLTLRRVRMKSRDVGEGDGAKMVQTLRYLREGITRDLELASGALGVSPRLRQTCALPAATRA